MRSVNIWKKHWTPDLRIQFGIFGFVLGFVSGLCSYVFNLGFHGDWAVSDQLTIVNSIITLVASLFIAYQLPRLLHKKSWKGDYCVLRINSMLDKVSNLVSRISMDVDGVEPLKIITAFDEIRGDISRLISHMIKLNANKRTNSCLGKLKDRVNSLNKLMTGDIVEVKEGLFLYDRRQRILISQHYQQICQLSDDLSFHVQNMD